MSEKPTIQVLEQSKQQSKYNWMNINYGSTRIGKLRSLIVGRTLTIYSINIFPEFERQGYARKVIKTFQTRFDIIIADRVRCTAKEFWEKMDFIDKKDGTYIWKSRRE
ncbi:hypothetical protein ES705_15791 [subsurface metagenome]